MSDERTFAQLLPPAQECSGCGQVDDHPKHHYGDRRYHFDCLTDEVYDDSFGHLECDDRERIDQLIAHAHGKDAEHHHGDALRAWHIVNDPNQPDHNKRAAKELIGNG